MSKTQTKENILQWIIRHWPVTSKQIKSEFDIFPTMIYRHLKSLLDNNLIKKIGTPPKVYYQWIIKNEVKQSQNNILSYKSIEFLNQNYYTYDSDGQVMSWYEWFISWCDQRWLDVETQYNKYFSILSSINKKKDNLWLIDWYKTLSPKLWKIYIDDLFFIDTYQVWHFGRSKLWSITFYAKQSQQKELIKKVVDIIKYQILSYIKQNRIDWICFIPPSIKRWIQLMTEIQKKLDIKLPYIKLIKIFPSNVTIPQKSLKTMEQRIKNASNTFFVVSWQKPLNHILLIDDFMGSGSTINFSAKKILDVWLAKKISAITLLGNIDTKYDVINEI